VSDANSSTTAATKVGTGPIRKKAKEPPYLYTLNFNKSETMIFAGGAGRAEYRIFDW